MNLKNLNQSIRQTTYAMLNRSRRPLDSRKVAKLISARFQTSIFRVWGNISYMEKTGVIRFVSKKSGGPSYVA